MTSSTANSTLNTWLDSGVTDQETHLAMGKVFLRATVTIPSFGDPATPGGFAPLMTDYDSYKCLLAVTSPAALKRVESMARYTLERTGWEMIKDLDPKVGVIIDNGTKVGVFPPAILRYLRDTQPQRGQA